MFESIALNPRHKLANYFGEIKGFPRSIYTANTHNKRQMGVETGREMINVFADF